MSFILNSGRFGAAADPGLTLLQSATLWLDASDPGSDSQKAQNKGTGGTALDARFGSTTGVDTNDPLLLTHTGTNYLYLPGSANDNATAPDSAAISPSTEIELLIRVKLASYSANQVLIMKTAGTSDFQWDINGGLIRFVWWNSGGGLSAPSVSGGSLVAGTDYWLRVTANSTETKFFQAAGSSTIPSSWTQIGATQAGITTIRDAATAISVGTSSAGEIYRAILRTTIGGANQFDADFTANTNQSSFTESSSNAATVTINRSSAGRKSVMVTRPVWLFGTDDYMEIADNALLDMGATDPFTVLVVGRAWGTQGTNDTLVAKKADVTNTTAGYLLANHGTTALQLQADIGDGTNGIEATSASRTAGDRKVWAMVRSVASDNLTTYINTTAGTSVTDTTTATLANAEVLRIGRLSGAGTEYADVEIDTVVLVKGTAYDSTQIGQIMTYLGVS